VNTTHALPSDRLKQFGETQLAGIATHDIQKSTVHLILTTTFFTGAAMGMAKLSDTPQKAYLNSLHVFLEERFGLSTDNAAGLIQSNARLYKRYVLIEKIYSAGWESARDWCQQAETQSDSLKTLLKQYQDLSMSGLSIEGIKEQKVSTPVEVEKIIATASQGAVEQTPTHWKRAIFLIILLVLFGGATYAALFTNLFSTLGPVLHSMLESIQEQLSALPLEEWLNKALSLIPK
jgi:hypothetical protein